MTPRRNLPSSRKKEKHLSLCSQKKGGGGDKNIVLKKKEMAIHPSPGSHQKNAPKTTKTYRPSKQKNQVAWG